MQAVYDKYLMTELGAMWYFEKPVVKGCLGFPSQFIEASCTIKANT